MSRPVPEGARRASRRGRRLRPALPPNWRHGAPQPRASTPRRRATASSTNVPARPAPRPSRACPSTPRGVHRQKTPHHAHAFDYSGQVVLNTASRPQSSRAGPSAQADGEGPAAARFGSTARPPCRVPRSGRVAGLQSAAYGQLGQLGVAQDPRSGPPGRSRDRACAALYDFHVMHTV